MLLVRSLDATSSIYKTRVLLLFASYVEELHEEVSHRSWRSKSAGTGVGDEHQLEAGHDGIETLYAALPILAHIAVGCACIGTPACAYACTVARS